MQVFELNPDSPERDLAREIAALLRKGKIVAYPTDTLYALGADAFNHEAVHGITILKGRDGMKPFPHIIDTVERLDTWEIKLSPIAEAIAKEFWPGPVSLVVNGCEGLPRQVLDEKGKICIRVPRNNIARSIAGLAGGLLVATSANPSGCPPSRSAQEAIEYFRGEIAAVVDGGPSDQALPSTIVDVSEGKVVILREGAVPSERILAALAQAQKRLDI